MAEMARLARFLIDAAHGDERFAAYAEYVEAVQNETGTLVWELCAEAEDESVSWLDIRAADAAALEAHRSSPAVQQLGLVLMPAIADTPEFHDLVPQHFKRR